MYLIYFFALIGATVCAIFGWTILKEVRRALLQSHRIATAGAREYLGRRHCTYREWFYHFVRDFMSVYSTTQIGQFEFDHDPSVPASSTWR